jgi:hypothetical protein
MSIVNNNNSTVPEELPSGRTAAANININKLQSRSRI